MDAVFLRDNVTLPYYVTANQLRRRNRTRGNAVKVSKRSTKRLFYFFITTVLSG